MTMDWTRAEREAAEIVERVDRETILGMGMIELGPLPCPDCRRSIAWVGAGWVDVEVIRRYGDRPDVWWLHVSTCPARARTAADPLYVDEDAALGAIAERDLELVTGYLTPRSLESGRLPGIVERRPSILPLLSLGLAAAAVWALAVIGLGTVIAWVVELAR